MADLISSEQHKMLGVLHGAGGLADMPQPYARDIMLYETRIVGTQFVENIKELEPSIHVGDKVSLFREPNNPYDANAIVVKTQSGQKLGHVPRIDNIVFSRLMDAGKLLFGIITYKEIVNDCPMLEMTIYLHE